MGRPLWGGGSFIVDDEEPRFVATPEDFTEGQRKLADTVQDFVEGEVSPFAPDIEKLECESTVRLLRKAGEIGLMDASVPASCSGRGLGITGATLLAEKLAPASSFAFAFFTHTGRGALPLSFFGSPEQKTRWLPGLAKGERISACGLTEPGWGSDASTASITAALTEDGRHYVLRGSKPHVANAGFADLFIVYAKADGTPFNAFIVERNTPGLTVEPEELRAGLQGSSICSLTFENALIPAENLIGEAGKGHRVAAGTLNLCRLKLAAGCLGSMKEAIAITASYANRTEHSGKPLSSYPLIAAKLSDMNARAFAAESMAYRTAGLIDEALDRIESGSLDCGRQAVSAIAEYALECSVNKVFVSEALDAVVDEGVQICGGLGYIGECKIERLYRASRVYRILEGTNEINRLQIPAMLLKRALRGDLPLLDRAQGLRRELLDPSPLPLSSVSARDPLAKPTTLLTALKKTFLMVGGLAVQKHGLRLEREQPIVASLADAMIDVYALESALLRTRKFLLNGGDSGAAAHPIDMTALIAEQAAERAGQRSRVILAAMEKGESLRLQLSVLKRLLRFEPGDVSGLLKRIAARVIAEEGYVGL